MPNNLRPRWAGGGRARPGSYTIRAGRNMHWRHPDTGAVGASNTLQGGLAYVDAGFCPLGRRKLLRHVYTAPRYTLGGPNRLCTQRAYLRVLYRHAAIVPPVPEVKP